MQITFRKISDERHELTEEFIERVLEKMRWLRGAWNATPFGGSMNLDWPTSESQDA